jgi:hypothetical protein
MNTDQSNEQDNLSKPVPELTAEQLQQSFKKMGRKIRELAWAVGSPVYYAIGDLLIAEYEEGRRMIVEEVDGVMKETGKYNGSTD